MPRPAQSRWDRTGVVARVRGFLVLAGVLLLGRSVGSEWPVRWVWVFGWNLASDREVAEVTRVLESGAAHGINGAVVSFGLDSLCRRDEAYFRRLETVRLTADRLGLELIPSMFSVGYGGGFLTHDRNLAEGLPVREVPFLVRDGVGRFVPDESVRLVNGGFEESEGNRFRGFGMVDRPGVVAFADAGVRHSGRASLRLENFGSDPHGHGRVMQEVAVRSNRCYRVSVWVKTEGLRPTGALRCFVLAGNRELAPRTFALPGTTGDWRRISYLFNSRGFDRVRLYAGLWEGREGRVWLDDWTLEEAGPVNVLRRPGTPVTVASEDGATRYEEGKDYAPFHDPEFNPWRGDSAPVPLRILPGGRLQEGQRLRVSWYHALLINDSQVTVCMGEPALDAIFDHEARLVAERLHPRHVLLNMDEVRMGGTCEACRGRDMARLLGDCVTRQVAALRRHAPQVQVGIWSDMFDPGHNARPQYYLVEGDFTGSWNYLPKDLLIGVWGGEPRPKSLQFFADAGFATFVACYYDAGNLDGVKAWMAAARGIPGGRGFMYTPWEKKYDLLPAFGDLLTGP